MDAVLGFDITKHREYQGYAREAAHRILYTTVNSQGMNGFVHGVEFVRGFPYYYLILIGWDVIALGGLLYLSTRLIKNIKNKEE